MNRAVSALKRTYETPVFPELDAARSALGAKIDAKLGHLKVGCSPPSHMTPGADEFLNGLAGR